ncbi:MAG TPA: non-reducing end alpha-L-arabinofuranosidase family hydrolase [bacterium]|nr:non-reducing end alpha-L-arabinofuranosidase family hydrolase [bacterium]
MKKPYCMLVFILVCVFYQNSGIAQFHWVVGQPLLTAGKPGTFDDIAVKDPSIVYYQGNWHLFYTARGAEKYSLGYVSAEELNELSTAKRHQLDQLRGRTSPYAAAPQVLFFEPQETWYLIFQTRDARYQPVYATSPDIADPGSWSRPVPLTPKDEEAKWIDFWVICDTDSAYFFYTREHRDVYLQTTTLDRFPDGFGNPRKVFSGVHEAVHIYRAAGATKYHMIYELRIDNVRSYGLATAPALTGPWAKRTATYATGEQLRFPDGVPRWTEMVSHGEAIRAGYDQTLLYDATDPTWIFQGLRLEQFTGEYSKLPWRLGLLKRE